MSNASAIFLQEVATGSPVEAELVDGIDDEHLIDWKAKWQPALAEIIKRIHSQGHPRSKWPQTWHWDWGAKAAEIPGTLAFRGVAVPCKGDTQGLMRADLQARAYAPAHAGKDLVYVDYLETAPWNWAESMPGPRYRGVGSALITAAIALSVDEGHSGRIGLHALPQSEAFYARSGLVRLGRDRSNQNLTYFEMTADAARAFLQEVGDRK